MDLMISINIWFLISLCLMCVILGMLLVSSPRDRGRSNNRYPY